MLGVRALLPQPWGTKMLREKPNLIKTLIAIFTLIGMVAGGITFIDSKIDTKMAMAEEEAVKTFKMEQQLLRLELRDAQRDYDLRYLEQLRCQKVIIEKELARNPDDTWARENLERIKNKIKLLEHKLYQ